RSCQSLQVKLGDDPADGASDPSSSDAAPSPMEDNQAKEANQAKAANQADAASLSFVTSSSPRLQHPVEEDVAAAAAGANSAAQAQAGDDHAAPDLDPDAAAEAEAVFQECQAVHARAL